MTAATPNSSFTIRPIGVMHTPFGEKFSVPRQSRLAPSVLSCLEFFAPYSDPLAFEGIDSFSHLHVIFLFNQIEDGPFHPRVRPPRLGGNKRIGVFASRSPFRPGRIGLSVVKLERVEIRDNQVRLILSGADMVDGTPVLDIKPYIPFVDAVADASGGFAQEPPPQRQVRFSRPALEALNGMPPDVKTALTEILAQDPRPAYKTAVDHKEYKVFLYNKNICFKVNGDVLTVTAVEDLGEM